MRHHDKNRGVLNRKRGPRVALMRSLARSLVIHGAITTTLPKARALRPFIERLVTLARKNTLSSQRLVSSRLGNDNDASMKLHTDIAPKYLERAGGYTRITKLGTIGAMVGESAKIEFV